MTLDCLLPSQDTTLGCYGSNNFVGLSVCDMTKYKNMCTSSVIMTTVNKELFHGKFIFLVLVKTSWIKLRKCYMKSEIAHSHFQFFGFLNFESQVVYCVSEQHNGPCSRESEVQIPVGSKDFSLLHIVQTRCET